MKIMRKVLLFILMILPFTVFTQERTTTKVYEFGGKSGILKSATGWAYNQELDEWIENPNFISNRKHNIPSTNNDLYRYASSLWGAPNFNSIQFKKVVINDETYYCMFYKKNEGKYKYPTIKKEWEVSEVTLLYLYTQEEFNNFINLPEEAVKVTPVAIMREESFSRTSDSDLIKKLKAIVDSGKVGTIGYFYIKKYKDNARFLIPTADYEKIDFEKNYFEVSVDEFKKLSTFE